MVCKNCGEAVVFSGPPHICNAVHFEETTSLKVKAAMIQAIIELPDDCDYSDLGHSIGFILGIYEEAEDGPFSEDIFLDGVDRGLARARGEDGV